MRAICRDDGFPARATVFRWLAEHPTFAEHYARAREAQVDSFIDEVVDIADDDGLDLNDKRARIDARKWVVERLRPKKEVERTSAATDPALSPKFDLTRVSDEQLDQLEAILAKAAVPGGGRDGEGAPPNRADEPADG